MSSSDPEPKNPMQAARRLATPPKQTRFYTDVEAKPEEGGYALRLDGKRALTPGRRPLVIPHAEIAAAIAEEWAAQEEKIDPATMPLTRIVNSALDGVATQMDAVREEIVRYAGSDLICYRAGEPASLVERQETAWAPLVASGDFRALFVLTSERSAKWPDVPTMRDLGYPFAFDSPFGLAGPKGMPADVVKKLHDAFKKAYDHPSAPAMFDKFDFTRRYLSTEDFAAMAPKYYAAEREGLERVGLVKK